MLNKKRRLIFMLIAVVATVAVATAMVLAHPTGGAAVATNDPNQGRPKTSSGTDVTPAQPQPYEVPNGTFDQPFADGRAVNSAAMATRELSFNPAIAASLGAPTKVFVHEVLRPQALALIYDDPARLVVTEEPVQMSEDLQRQALSDMATRCDPTTGCVGSWTIHALDDGNPALAISVPGKINAVIWIHKGGIRYQLMGPGASLTASAALALANTIEDAP